MRNGPLTGHAATDGVRCPRCGSSTLVNANGDRWCTFVGGRDTAACDWGLAADVYWPLGQAQPTQRDGDETIGWSIAVDSADGDVEGFVWGFGATRDEAIVGPMRELVAMIEAGDVEPGRYPVTIYENATWREVPEGHSIVTYGREEERVVLASRDAWRLLDEVPHG